MVTRVEIEPELINGSDEIDVTRKHHRRKEEEKCDAGVEGKWMSRD